MWCEISVQVNIWNNSSKTNCSFLRKWINIYNVVTYDTTKNSYISLRNIKIPYKNSLHKNPKTSSSSVDRSFKFKIIQ